MASSKPSKESRRKKEKAAKRKRPATARTTPPVEPKVWKGPVTNSECRLDVVVSGAMCYPGAPERCVSAIIDTGATVSGISERLANELGLSRVSTIELGTTHGTVTADVVIARVKIESGGKPTSGLMKLAIIPDPRDDMIFGMNALDGGVLTVDLVKYKWEWHLYHFAPAP